MQSTKINELSGPNTHKYFRRGHLRGYGCVETMMSKLLGTRWHECTDPICMQQDGEDKHERVVALLI